MINNPFASPSYSGNII